MFAEVGQSASCSFFSEHCVKADKAMKIGSAVVDENLKVVGKIFDVIGPVPAPYAVVKPEIKKSEKLVGKQLYLLLSKKKRSKK